MHLFHFQIPRLITLNSKQLTALEAGRQRCLYTTESRLVATYPTRTVNSIHLLYISKREPVRSLCIGNENIIVVIRSAAVIMIIIVFVWDNVNHVRYCERPLWRYIKFKQCKGP